MEHSETGWNVWRTPVEERARAGRWTWEAWVDRRVMRGWEDDRAEADKVAQQAMRELEVS